MYYMFNKEEKPFRIEGDFVLVFWKASQKRMNTLSFLESQIWYLFFENIVLNWVRKD